MRKTITTLFLMASICLAGTANLWALDQTEGVYQIGTAQDLVDFAALVNGGEYTANAVLTADIDMSSVENFTPIGTYTSNGEQLYKGTFDGQGHKISHLTIDWPGANAIGLFNTGDNVHLLDFWLDDQCVISGNENIGLVGRHQGIGASFERIGNAGNINGTAANAGGLFGVAVASSGGAVVNACWTSGNIVSVGRGAAFVGWFASGGSAFTFTNCWTVADVSNPTSDGTYVARYGTAPAFRNCWSLHGTQVGRVGSIELFHSGRVCWYINNQAGMNVWYQTLGEDDLPLPDETHGVVYRTGKILCDDSDTEETVYSNTPGETEKPEHNFVDGICTLCNSYNPDQIVDGVYQISNPQQLVWFSDYVNSGKTNAKAALTADIDMEGIEGFMPIGLYHDAVAAADLSNYNMQFTGSFDGQKHVIKNLKIVTDGYYEAGLFSRIYQATVKNLGIVDANITTNAETGRIGAIVGLNREGTIENCWSAGTLNFVSTGSSAAFGGIAGNTNNSSGKFIKCWSTFEGPLTTGSGTQTNCYSYATNENIVAEARNGQLCYTLNNGAFIDPQWFQNVGEDNYPSWDASKGIVYPTTEGYESFDPQNKDSYGIFRDHLMAVEAKFVEETKAYKGLLDAYQQQVDAWENIETFEAFCAAYLAAQEQKSAIRTSEAAYKTYIDACEYAINYLAENRFKSEMRTFLEGYLEKSEAPSEDYAHGTYRYIVTELQLNNEEIAAETEYVNDLLQRTIATNIVPGTEVTVTMKNADFKEGLEGWTVEADGATVAAGGEVSLMPVVTGMKTPFTVSQTLTDIPNGIYVMTANGFSRAGTDITSTYHSAQFFMNGNQNYMMTPSEDLVTKDEATDGVNCHITGDGADVEYLYADVEGYVPGSATGASYAFAAGRYTDSIAVEVTDSMLQIGARNLGTGLADDWTAFGNVHVYYLGSAEQASEKLTDVVACYMARAQALLDFPWTDSEEYYLYPNMSEELKSSLETYIGQGATATTGEEKMAVINALSATMAEVYACRMAYIKMAEMAEALIDKTVMMNDNGLIDEDMYNEYCARADVGWSAYQNGTVSTEEAQRIAAELEEVLNSIGGVWKDKDGFYQIKTANDLMIFAVMVNSGELGANAKLMNDIDMAEATNFTGIGVPRDILYTGTFDGQGHKISNMTIEIPDATDVGMFHIGGGAVLRDFWLDESCLISGYKEVGIVGWCNAATGATLERVGNAGKVSGGENTSALMGRGWCNSANPLQFINCWTVGEVDNSGSNGGTTGNWIGWCSNWSASFTNCWTISKFAVAPADANYLTRKGDNVKFNNCYTLRGSQATRMTEEDVASGALCFKLNGDQSEITWYQTLGEGGDPYPVLDPTHGRVYMNVAQNCDGTPKGEVVYSNSDNGSVRDPHNYVDGICTGCGAYDPDLIVDGVYQIGTSAQLVWFANFVNKGNNKTPAALIADIDLAGVENFTPIGLYHDSMADVQDTKITYQGSFDGQGHVIRNLTVNTDGYYEAGLFSRTQNATIKNLGVVNATVTTNNPKGRVGVFAGLHHNGTMQNCFSAGSIVLSTTAGVQAFGGIAGTAPNANSKYINCYTTYEGAIATPEGSAITLQNCFSFADNANIAADAQSGALCYALNEGAGETIYYQTIGEDQYPVLDDTHGVVVKNDDGTYGNATGVEAVRLSSESAVYDLSGRRIDGTKLPKGIYIVNGKKILK